MSIIISPARPDAPQPVAVPAYHRLSHAWRSPRRWRPLLALALSTVVYVAIALTTLVALAVWVAIAELAGWIETAEIPESLDLYQPLDFTIVMLSVALMLPAVLLGFRLAGCAPIGLLSSVAGRLRWGWLMRCTVPAVAVLAIAVAADLSVMQPDLRSAPTGSLALVLLILVITPVQAAAEEYVFRGALMQAIGAWLRHPAWAILLPVPLFVFGHDYDLPGQLSVGVFAVAMGWITWRTGGLEAAIALHVVNNLVALLAGAAGLADLNSTETTWAAGLLSALIPTAYVLWVDRAYRRRAQAAGSGLCATTATAVS